MTQPKKLLQVYEKKIVLEIEREEKVLVVDDKDMEEDDINSLSSS